MVVCPNCNKELEDGTVFCDNCGAKVFETIFCPNCGEKTSTEFDFCEKCGTSLKEENKVSEPQKNQVKPVKPAASGGTVPALQMPKKPIPKKVMLAGGLCAVVLIVAFLAKSLFSGMGGADNYALYLKDKEIVYTDFSKDGIQEITFNLLNGEYVNESELEDVADSVADYVLVSKDGKRIFYPDRSSMEEAGFVLYCKNLNKPKEEPIKLDSDVRSFQVNDKGNCVTYLKGADGILYQHDLKEKEKIASDVEEFKVSEDGKKIGYYKDGSYYVQYTGKESVKLASDIETLAYVSDDISTIYYMKEGSLYKREETAEDKQKIASDICDVLKIYDTGEAYYYRKEEVEYRSIDLVEDDMASIDAEMWKPEPPKSPSWWDFGYDREAYDAAIAEYNNNYELYEAAYDEYRAKLNRDDIREALMNDTTTNVKFSLYYFNGLEEVDIAENFAAWSGGYAEESPVAVFVESRDMSEITKVKMSELVVPDRTGQFYDYLLHNVPYSSMKYLKVAVAGNVTEVDYEQTGIQNIQVSADGNLVYFKDNMEEHSGDLYRLEIANGAVGSPKLYDTEVSDYYGRFLSEKCFAYYKNVDSGKGDLYIDKEEIDYDVRTTYENCSANEDSENFFYYTDWNDEKNYGTLKVYKNGKATKIADDVHSYWENPKGELLYLHDFSRNTYKGTLFLYKNGEAQKIDDDVMGIIPIRQN